MSIFSKGLNKTNNLSFDDKLFDSFPSGLVLLDEKGKIKRANRALSLLTGISVKRLQHMDFFKLFSFKGEINFTEIQSSQGVFRKELFFSQNNKDKWLACEISSYSLAEKEEKSYLVILRDITDEKAEHGRYNWLMNKKPERLEAAHNIPPYGDLTELNSSRLIYDSVGKENLENICGELIELLDTSLAIYERNGDYALGIFASGWCRFLDATSRNLCNSCSNREALTSGKWLCHESCWKISKKAMETKAPVDNACNGRIRIYAEPIFADGQVVGAINFGYGSPPESKKELVNLAALYKCDIEELRKKAFDARALPDFIIENAKKRLHNLALLIGDIVELNQKKAALQKSEENFKMLTELTFEGLIIHKDGIIIDVNENFTKLTGWKREEAIGENLLHYLSRDTDLAVVKENLLKEYAKPYIVQAKHKDGRDITVELEARNVHYQGEHLRLVAGKDVTARYQYELKLKESNERFRLLVNQAPEMLFLHDKTGKIVEVNESTLNKYGYTKEELLKMKTEDIDPDFLERVDENRFWEKVQIGKPVSFRARHKKKDGSIFPVEITLGQLTINGEKHYMALAKDISNRIKAEKAIKANQERFETLLENIPDSVFLLEGETGKILRVNKAAEENYGYNRREFLAMTLYDINRGENKSQIEVLLNSIKEEISLENKWLHARKDGSEISVEQHSHFFIYDSKPLIISICRDISEKEKAAESLKRSEEMFRLLAENSLDCIWQMTPRLKFTYLSPSLFMMTGFYPEEWIGTHLWEHTTKLEFIKMARLAIKLVKNFQKREYIFFETRMFNKAGELKHLEINAKPLIRDGKLIGLQGSTRVIEERKRQERELEKYRQNLEKLVQERTSELESKNAELMHYNKLFVGREFRIKELRDEVKELKKKIREYETI